MSCMLLAHLAKGNVSFCHHLASVVRRLSSVIFSHFNLLLCGLMYGHNGQLPGGSKSK